MGRIMPIQVRQASAPISPIYMCTDYDNGSRLYRWPGSSGIATVDVVNFISGSTGGPMVFYPGVGDDGLGLIYFFSTSGSTTSIHAFSHNLGYQGVVATFSYITPPITLNKAGGSTPPFPANPDGGSGYTLTNVPMMPIAVFADVDNGLIYLGCRDQAGTILTTNSSSISILVSFDPVGNTTSLVTGPWQPMSFRPTYYPSGGAPYITVPSHGFYADIGGPGFVCRVGGTLFWSTGAQIFSESNGWASPIYDDLETPGAFNYAKHYPGFIDTTSGNYWFGASGSDWTSTVSNDGTAPGGITQWVPDFTAGTTSTSTAGSRNMPISPVGQSFSTYDPTYGTGVNGYRTSLGFMLSGVGTTQPTTRAVLALDSGGGVSIVYEDSRTDEAIVRSNMGAVRVLWNGTDSSAGYAGVVGWQMDWGGSGPPSDSEKVSSYGGDSGGFSLDADGTASFGTAFGQYQVPVTFAYHGKLMALQRVRTGIADDKTLLLQRSSAGTWSVIASDLGLTISNSGSQESRWSYFVVSALATVNV